MYAAIVPAPLSFSLAESTVLRLQINYKTFFVVILNGICLLAVNIRVKTLRENYSCNSLPTPLVFISGYANKANVFYCLRYFPWNVLLSNFF